MTKLVANVTAPNAGQWWSTFEVSQLKNADGSSPVASKFIFLNFKSPAPANKDNITVEPWVDATFSIANKKIESALYDVTIKIVPKELPYKLDKAAKIKISVAGDLRGEDAKKKYFDTFVLYTDEEPDLSGKVKVEVAASPDSALAGIPVEVHFTQGGIVVPAKLGFGTTREVPLSPAGSYAVSAKPVATEGETVSAPVVLSPQSVKVAIGQTVPLSVKFGTVVKQGAIDVTISGDLKAELGTETLAGQVVDKGGTVLKEFTGQVGQTSPVRGLPPDHDVEVRMRDITLNNVKYAFKPQGFKLGVPVAKATIDSSSVTRTPLDTKGFISQKVTVTADTTLSREFLVRLTGADISYAGCLSAKSGTVDFPYQLEPGRYTIKTTSFIDNGTVYTVTPQVTAFDASATTPVRIDITTGAKLLVPGFPAFLSFGACADLTPGNVADFAAARASAIFKYAGFNGAGDDEVFLEDDTATRKTIQTTRDIETTVGGGHRVLPVMISYTCNLSLGDTKKILLDANRHMYSYGNYILALSIARDKADSDHPVSAAFIVNADFLGACQQEKLPPKGKIDGQEVPVREPLKKAIQHAVQKKWLTKEIDIPADITEDINGYVRSVNWLTRAVAGAKVSLGWVSNLWGVGGSSWIYSDEGVIENANSTADYAIAAGVFEGEHGADFHAVDRYEADDLTVRAYGNGYCYGPHEWPRYYDFCAAVGRRLKKPVMPWQIPASRLPSTADTVSTPFDDDHWGTGGSYLFGHPEIGGAVNNINATVKDVKLPSTFPPPYASKPVTDLFTRQPFDWSDPAYGDFPLRGIFSVLLGGGATTGIVHGIGRTGPWTGAKIKDYMGHPIPLTTSEALVPEQYTPAPSRETARTTHS